jgi:ABC-2 type transport system permease protein
VSRQEDVSQAVGPMALISTAGYFVGVYAATGLFDPGSTPIVVLTQVPFFTPFLILGRIASGDIAAWEVIVSVVLMIGAVALALWVAARIYAAGVLLYGQRPGLRRVWRLMREGM